ncbi:hypothetical protein F7Q90_24535 [Pantoea stewartii subsp. stewartii]|nr:hypothetical protein F7Q90_24535 [Pantoea stewartii subsp. stewartii]
MLTHRSSHAAFCSASYRYLLFPRCLYTGTSSAIKTALVAPVTVTASPTTHDNSMRSKETTLEENWTTF